MFVSWNILVPAAIFVAMFEKATLGHTWFRLHVGLMSLACLMMVIAFVLIVYVRGEGFDGLHAVWYEERMHILIML